MLCPSIGSLKFHRLKNARRDWWLFGIFVIAHIIYITPIIIVIDIIIDRRLSISILYTVLIIIEALIFFLRLAFLSIIPLLIHNIIIQFGILYVLLCSGVIKLCLVTQKKKKNVWMYYNLQAPLIQLIQRHVRCVQMYNALKHSYKYKITYSKNTMTSQTAKTWKNTNLIF